MNRYFDMLAPIYDRIIGQADPEKLLQLLQLPISGWLLEAGGGTGRISTLLRPLVGGLVLSDLSQSMLKQSRLKGNLLPVLGVAERLPFPDSAFDRVLVVDALHHFHDQRLAIGELIRVLKPGGRMVIEEPDINRWQGKLVALAEKVALMGSHFYPPEAIQAMVAIYGLSARVESDGGFAAWVVADK